MASKIKEKMAALQRTAEEAEQQNEELKAKINELTKQNEDQALEIESFQVRDEGKR